MYGVSGVIGKFPGENMIIVAFKAAGDPGSIEQDFDSKLTENLLWPECNCKVHRGYQRQVIA